MGGVERERGSSFRASVYGVRVSSVWVVTVTLPEMSAFHNDPPAVPDNYSTSEIEPANAPDATDKEISASVASLPAHSAIITRGRSKEGYGFKPSISGIPTPNPGRETPRSPSLIPDVNGLGWPGSF